MLSTKKRHLLKSFSKGFTLVELIASIAIMTMIMTVVIYNHRKFDSQLELTNTAYRVAVSIREAQVYGIGAKELNGSFNIPYGVSFYNNDFRESNYVFFGDSNPDLGDYPNVYDGPLTAGCVGASATTGDPLDECIERITLGRGNIIKKVCGFGSSLTSSGACIPMGSTTGGPYVGIKSFSVVFKRPKSDAIITASKVPAGANIPVTNALEPLTDLYICLQSPEGKDKAVHVSSAGQISVEDVTASPGIGSCLGN